MFHINDYFTRLPGSYLFAEIARRVKAYSAAHPDADIIRLGIGDVTRPLAPCVVEAGLKAVAEMGDGTVYCVDGAASEDNSVKALRRRMRGKIVVIDGVSKISALVEKAGGTIVVKAAVLAEGEAARRHDIVFLETIPLL